MIMGLCARASVVNPCVILTRSVLPYNKCTIPKSQEYVHSHTRLLQN